MGDPSARFTTGLPLQVPGPHPTLSWTPGVWPTAWLHTAPWCPLKQKAEDGCVVEEAQNRRLDPEVRDLSSP